MSKIEVLNFYIQHNLRIHIVVIGYPYCNDWVATLSLRHYDTINVKRQFDGYRRLNCNKHKMQRIQHAMYWKQEISDEDCTYASLYFIFFAFSVNGAYLKQKKKY